MTSDLATRPTISRAPGRWISDWRPDDPDFWVRGGAQVAKRNLVWSIFAEHLGFSVWLIWSVSAVFLPQMGFAFTPSQLFVLVALPNLVGSLLRIPYTLAVPRFGGRNWTTVSALLLIIPTLGYVMAVSDKGTPYWVFCLIAATAGLGGGNFASSMANINFFYPADKKGAALGLNAAGGNLGVALIQLLLPVIVGGAGLFGLVKAAEGGIHLERAAYVYIALALLAAAAAWFFMDNLRVARSRAVEQFAVLKERQTWLMAVLYIGTFGSFIGYSAAMPLLIKMSFFVPTPAPSGTGINFAYYAFLGALVGSVARPVGGRLADKYGGARVTLATFLVMGVATLGVLWTLTQLTPNPTADPAIAMANKSWFPWFLGAFLVVFAATGIGNGSTYKMIPAIWRTKAERTTGAGTPEREAGLRLANTRSSAAIGIIGAIGAIGGFLIPLTFGAPWVDEPAAAVRSAFTVFAGFYAVCAVITWFAYLRSPSYAGRGASLAGADI